MSGAGDYDIFISYTHEDGDTAKRLADELAGRGWSVFWDRTLLPGATWRSQIQSALSAAKVVVVMWSHKSVASRWVEIEADHAFQRDVYIPVKIDDSSLPLGLSHVQVADLRHWHGDPRHLLPEVLISALQYRLGTTARSAKAPPPAPQPPLRTGDIADATMVAADSLIRLCGAAASGEKYEISVRLSQLRMKPEGLVIGRVAAQCDLAVSHASVSRRHALLAAADGRLTLCDLGSTNGTFVNDRPALRERPLELARGALVRLGDVELLVEGILH
jgi:hypothetical protein